MGWEDDFADCCQPAIVSNVAAQRAVSAQCLMKGEAIDNSSAIPVLCIRSGSFFSQGRSGRDRLVWLQDHAVLSH